MAKTPGWKTAGIPQLKDIRAGLLKGDQNMREQEREIASARIDDNKKRLSAKGRQRQVDAAIMEKSLVKYPKNPPMGVWEYDPAKKSFGKGVKKVGDTVIEEDVHPRKARANRKGNKASAREARKQARLTLRQSKLEAREKSKADRTAKRAERQALREERKRIANLPPMLLNPEVIDTIMENVNEVFGLNARQLARWRKVAERFSKMPLAKQVKRSHIFEIRSSVIKALVYEEKEIARAIEGGQDAQQWLEKAPVKKVAKQAPKSKATPTSKPITQKAPKAPQSHK